MFTLNYIKEQYIFQDDTVKTMRNKICVSLSMNPKFDKDNKLLPEYQYFGLNIMLIIKLIELCWVKNGLEENELLSIDIQPNSNLKV